MSSGPRNVHRREEKNGSIDGDSRKPRPAAVYGETDTAGVKMAAGPLRKH